MYKDRRKEEKETRFESGEAYTETNLGKCFLNDKEQNHGSPGNIVL